MSWAICDEMKARERFLSDAKQAVLPLAEVCRRHGISRKTGYKWLRREREEGAGVMLGDRSRKPLESPRRCSARIEEMVLAVRREHPCWGGRKIVRVLAAEGLGAPLPAPSTVTNILRRHGMLGGGMREGSTAFRRFERGEPNDLWQMDFKGHFALAGGARCHPLTVLDDHSRYNLVLAACAGETRETVHGLLESAFRRYGLPRQILCDHGSPWGTGLREDGRAYGRTALSYWLVRLGVELIHGRVRHPQTQGKEERFHRTLEVEVLRRETVWRDLGHCQQQFDLWSEIYNRKRPHEGLGMARPADRYRLSERRYPERLAEVESFYVTGDKLRKVQSKGEINFGNLTYAIGSALIGEVVALRASDEGGLDVYYCWKKLGTIKPREAAKAKGRQNPMVE